MKAQPLQLGRVQSGLATERLGTKLHYFFELDSTNRYARSLAAKGSMEGEIVIAEQQTQGRGRLGRPWISPPYINLYCSFLLRPEIQPEHAPQITLTAAVALAETVDAFSPIHCAIKWPNDILIKDRKLAGILIEASCSGAGLDYVVLGIGVNLNFAPEAMPAAISGRATSLLAVRKQEVNREEFLRRLIQDLDRCYGILQDQGFGALAPRWETRFFSKGKKVQVELGDCVLYGTPVGIDSDGALILRTEDDNLQRIIAGDVIPALE